MAKRGHNREGKVFCSECGSIIDKESAKCEHCTEPLDGDFQAVICPYCATVLDSASENCINCGLRFKKDEPCGGRSKEDEEFLSKLLDWGRNLEQRRVAEDKEETNKATDTFKDVMGASIPTSYQEETLKEITKSAEERAEFAKREESIIQMATPLRKALDLRKKALNDLESRIKPLRNELDCLDSDDVEIDKKRSEIERQMAEIMVERGAIQSLEENISNMDYAYRQLLKKHSIETREKEENLNTRLNAFKSEMVRREKEKKKLTHREEILANREKELVARIESLKMREISLEKTEDKLKDEIESLKEEKGGVEKLKKPASKLIMAKGKWLVDEEEIRGILKKSKKIREAWLEEQVSIQKAISSGENDEQAMGESKERLDTREKKLQEKIEILEETLARVKIEAKEIAAEEIILTIDEEKTKKVLKILDDLLEHLPEDIIDRFSKSEDYKHYNELMDELGL
ncbi:MAG: zinc ribbon domain-containing protein [Thermoplasmata archaeon]|nr:zinc ribbon domain-containing protein [Thermoplasmata archaeon]